MITFRKFLFTVFVVFSLFLMSLIALTQIERPTIFYDSYADIVRKNGFQNGWVPLWIPESVRNIHESHDIDTNERWLSFTLSKADKFNPEACHPIKKENAMLPRKRTFNLFSSFVHKMEKDLATNPHLSFFCCDQSRDGYLAINGQRDYAYFWHLGH